MDNKILMIVALIVTYIIMKFAARFYRKVSDGNSIKQEESFEWQAILFLILGILYILTIYIGNMFDSNLRLIILYSEIVVLAINVVSFIRMFLGQIYNYFKYQKGGDIWLIISVHFLKNLVLSYYLYNYYITYIAQ